MDMSNARDAETEFPQALPEMPSLYTCPNCGMDRPVMEFYSEDGQAYNHYCRPCLTSYMEAVQAAAAVDHGHGGQLQQQVAERMDEGRGHVLPLSLDQQQHLNMHQLLAAQVVDVETDAQPASHLPPPALMADPLLQPADLLHAAHGTHGMLAHIGQPQSSLMYAPEHQDAMAYAAAAEAEAAALQALPSKACTRCKQVKLEEEFPQLKGKRGARAAHCHDCRAAQEEARHERQGATAANDDAGGLPTVPPASEAQPMVYVPTVAEKRCMHCGLVKPASAFCRSKNKSDHLQNRCKACDQALGKGGRRDITQRPSVRVAQKYCCRCGLEKQADQFFLSKTSLDGLCTYCKACQQDLNRHSRSKRMEVLRVPVESKQCRQCKEDKGADQYFKSSVNVDGLYSYCKQCATAINTAARQRRRHQKRKGTKLQPADGAAQDAGLPMGAHEEDNAGASGGSRATAGMVHLAEHAAGSERAGEVQGAVGGYAEPGQYEVSAAGQAGADGAGQYGAYDSAAAQQYAQQYSQAYAQHYHAADAQHYVGFAHASIEEYAAQGMQPYHTPAGDGSEYQYDLAQVVATLQDYHHHGAAVAGGEHYRPEALQANAGRQENAAGASAAASHQFLAGVRSGSGLDAGEAQEPRSAGTADEQMRGSLQRKRGANNDMKDPETAAQPPSKRAVTTRKSAAAPVLPQRPKRK